MCIWVTEGQADKALAAAIEKYYRIQGWRKGLRQRVDWHANGESPTPEELFKRDEALAYECLNVCASFVRFPTEVVDALWLFVPEERRNEILGSILASEDYVPRARCSLGTGDLMGGGGANFEGMDATEVQGQDTPRRRRPAELRGS